jgi:kynurenine 3-monooxygenase
MRPSDTGKITLIGAGMAGSLLSILLARRGFQVELFERHSDPSGNGANASQPSDLALGERARNALQAAGLLKKADALSTPMRGRMMHDRSQQQTLQPYGSSGAEALHSISRQQLRQCLLNEAAASGKVRIRFNRSLKAVDWDTRSAIFTRDDAGSEEDRHDFDVMIGTDGPVSRLRREMNRVSELGVSEEMLDVGYKQISIPPDSAGKPRMDPNVLHVWPRGGYMMIAFPNLDSSFSALLFLPHSGDHKMPWGFKELDSWIRQKAFMRANFPDATPLMPALEQAFRNNPVGLMGTVRCRHWHLDGQALLIGDAAHVVVPFHGQGVNAAFEDCMTLVNILDNGSGDWQSVFRTLQDKRRENCNAIAEMSLDAFHTMRESVRHRDFLLRKALERELERRHPERFIARYSLVMFHRIPYIDAYQRGKAQAKILDELLDGKEKLTEVDLEQADLLIGERLSRIFATQIPG